MNDQEFSMQLKYSQLYILLYRVLKIILYILLYLVLRMILYILLYLVLRIIYCSVNSK